jgi:hypothetical protein
MASPPFAPVDLRSPTAQMQPIGLKLPADLIARIDRQAEILRTTRAALARTLVFRGLEQLEQAVAAAAPHHP